MHTSLCNQLGIEFPIFKHCGNDSLASRAAGQCAVHTTPPTHQRAHARLHCTACTHTSRYVCR